MLTRYHGHGGVTANNSSPWSAGDGTAAAELRLKRFRYAIASSLSSKVTTAALQLIAMPIAAKALGNHGFSLYAMISAAVVWLWLSNLGIGPAMVVAVASAHAAGDAAKEHRVASSALISILVISLTVSSVSMLAVWTLPVDRMFGPLYIADAHAIRSALSVLIVMFLLQMNLAAVESAQAGYQEQYILNLNATVSSLPCILAVIMVARYFPTVESIILAVNVPVVVFRLANAIAVLRRHRLIVPSLNAFSWSECRQLLRHGAAFSLASAVGHILSHVFPIILVGRVCNADVSASFAATMNCVVLASGVFSMLCTPLWPAIADSVARRDWQWAKKAYTRLLFSCMVYATFVATLLAQFGESLFRVWFRGTVSPNRNLLISAGLYFLTLGWESTHFTILVGLQRIERASLLVCARAILATLVTILTLQLKDAAIPFIAMFIAVICVDALPLRMLVNRNLAVSSDRTVF